jgi:hypothetical protein
MLEQLHGGAEDSSEPVPLQGSGAFVARDDLSGPRRGYDGAMLRGLACAVAALLSLFACSSGEPAQTAPGPSRDVRGEVLDSCVAFAERLCASAEPCCLESAGAFEHESCVAGVRAEVCSPAADAVAAGFATYHEESVEPCLAEHALSHQTCVADWSELVELRRGIWAACKVVRGTSAPGRSCTTSVTCAQPEGPSAARCVSGSCRLLELLQQGAECPYPNGEVSVCDQGLYCTTTERDQLGSCAPVTADGEACDPVALNPECGLGHYCDLADGVCRSATNFGGPSCEQGPECVSFDCDRISGECAVPLATVAELCPPML